jgi:hypothetical protein
MQIKAPKISRGLLKNLMKNRGRLKGDLQNWTNDGVFNQINSLFDNTGSDNFNRTFPALYVTRRMKK